MRKTTVQTVSRIGCRAGRQIIGERMLLSCAQLSVTSTPPAATAVTDMDRRKTGPLGMYDDDPAEH
ncbi:hypothetical protein ACQEVC_37655 [Plantactinospora sp. CA-294935]|uniref:hypothetical protein n=1 Tax=Plantactinospora sp. CA-294935 TaxID=3240012 RepID=UPI003D8BF9AD